MEIKFLGTAASEGIPNPFCNCNVCTQSRQLKGKNRRTRASALIDNSILIDMSPEWACQLERENLTARNIKAVFFTHTHPDHFNVGEFVSRAAGFAQNIDFPLQVFGNDCAIKGAFNALDGLQGDRFVFNLLKPFISTSFGEYKVTPVLANHAKMELCYNYLFEKDGKCFFYGLDSGFLPSETFEFLKSKKIDVAVLECTYAFKEGSRTNNHLNFASLYEEIEILRSQNTLSDNSVIITSHVSHSSGLLHDDLEALMKEHNIVTAFDGMTVTL